MKIRLCVSILAIVSAVTVTYAVGQSKQPQQGTIVNVQKQDARNRMWRPRPYEQVLMLIAHHCSRITISTTFLCD